MNVIKYGKSLIPYEVIKSTKRKTVSISVNKDGVKIICPADIPDEKIKGILKDKIIWVRKQLLHFEEINDYRHHRLFLSGEKLPYLGRQYRLKVITDTEIDKPIFKFSHGRFIAEVPKDSKKENYRELIFPLYEEWIKEKAHKYARNRINRFTSILQSEPSAIVIKNQEQRWGSCTPTGKILLNWRIFLAPVSVIDYVLVHELAHLKHLNHSNEFWETIKMLHPNFEEKKEWLRINGQSLYI